MNSQPVLVLVAAAVAGASLAASVAVAARSIPREAGVQRERPPLAWRLAWPLVVALAHWPGGLASPRYRFAAQRRLRQADLERALTPEQFLAGKCLCAALALMSIVGCTALVGAVHPIAVLGSLAAGSWLPDLWLRDRIASQRRRVHRDLPFYLDVVTLAVESGLNLTAALGYAVDQGPGGPVRAEFAQVLRDMRAGRTRAEALKAMADRLAMPAVASLVSALNTAERQGASLANVLRAQAEQRRSERFLLAERRAMEAPVKMLLPLLVFVFPCTFVVLFFPVAVRLAGEGWLP